MRNATGQKLYRALMLLLAVAAAVGTGLIVVFSLRKQEGGFSVSAGQWGAIAAAVVLFFLLPLDALVHEVGHLLFGACAGMRPLSVTVGHVTLCRRGVILSRRTSSDGVGYFVPFGTRGLRKRLAFTALGGAVCNLVYGGALLAVWLMGRTAPAALFFGLFAPFNLYEGVAALLPVETAEGKTDGKIFFGLIGRLPFAEVMLCVMRAQAIVLREGYKEVPYGLIFRTPVVREDDPSFIALTQLRWQYLFAKGDRAGAERELARLEELCEYLPSASRAEAACDLAYGYAVIGRDKARAERFLAEAEGAKGTCAYARAAASCGKLEAEKALERTEREPRGIAEFERYLLSCLHEEKQNPPD